MYTHHGTNIITGYIDESGGGLAVAGLVVRSAGEVGTGLEARLVHLVDWLVLLGEPIGTAEPLEASGRWPTRILHRAGHVQRLLLHHAPWLVRDSSRTRLVCVYKKKRNFLASSS